ncbi:serine/threonine-protein kinase PCRK1-like [Papaver somniferum]|uniref:serine/threonine-protein kinase PCRK1-like n=1 Tax=Papaver somniferum TaxID=3469 RepID=UPI000E6F7661|nr:serine/threonine-protein kinase PCRK1-like [Papaver somniferum]
MRCIQSDNGEKRNDLITTSTTRSSMPHLSYSSSTSTDDFRRLYSAFGSQNVSDISAGSSSQTPRRKHLRCPTQKSNNLRVFTLSEFKIATKNFNQLLMISEGGFGCVYRARINSSEDSRAKIDVAIKKLGKRGLQGHKEWVTEVNVLGVVDHKNLVKLVNYCNEDDERGEYVFVPQFNYASLQDRDGGLDLLASSVTWAPTSYFLRGTPVLETAYLRGAIGNSDPDSANGDPGSANGDPGS